ncbi:MAG: helix-turn-helix transcriptional regulator [Spirochaetes bacterium]|nr:helix-turn-helix transcriptional regulator [Spirochaetota bacterium]
MDYTVQHLIRTQRPFFSIGEGIHPDDFHMDFHTHDFFEIGYVIGGNGHYEVAEQDHVRQVGVQKDMCLLWDGATAHRAVDEPGTPLHQIIMTFDDSFIEGYSLLDRIRAVTRQRVPLCINDMLVTAGIRQILRRLIAEHRNNAAGSGDVCRALLVELLTMIYRRTSDTPGDAVRTQDGRIDAACSYIAAHYHEQMQVSSIAASLDVSVRYFSELFRVGTGKTFVEYVNTYRISMAQQMLTGGNERIITIAFESGFDSISHFNAMFKKITGMTPGEYRERNGAGR